MKKDRSGKGYPFPLGIFQRGGLIITLSEWEIIKELTFIQKILFSLGLRHMRNIEDMEHRISKLVARIAHNEIFGYEPDFGKFLFTINMEIGKKNWEVEKHLTLMDLEKADAIGTSNIMIRNKFIDLVSEPPMNMSLFDTYPEVCLTITPMTPYVLVQSIRYFVDVNHHYTFSAIRKSNHQNKDELIAYLYELLDLQAKNALSLLELLELCHTIQQKKGDSVFIKEEHDATEKANSIIIRLKSFIEKVTAFVGVVYGDTSVDSAKKHKTRERKIEEHIRESHKKHPYYQLFTAYIKRENFAELDNYRTGILHKKGSSDMQPHSFVGKKFDETPIRKLLGVIMEHRQRSSIALISALAIMTDELVKKEPPQKRFAMLLDLFELMDKLNLVKREEQINMLPDMLPKIIAMYMEHFGIDEPQDSTQPSEGEQPLQQNDKGKQQPHSQPRKHKTKHPSDDN